MSRPVRRRLAAPALALLLPLLGACGFGYQTDQVYQPAVGDNERGEDVDVLGAVIVSSTEGAGTFIATLVSTGTEGDELVSLTGEGVEAEILEPLEVDAQGVLNLAELGAVRVTGEGVEAGYNVPVTLEFSSGESIEVVAQVVDRAEEFADVTLAPAAGSPSATATPTE